MFVNILMHKKITMKRRINRHAVIILLVTTVFIFNACVPAKKYDELLTKRERCEKENMNQKKEIEQLTTQVNELKKDNYNKDSLINKLHADSQKLSDVYRNLNIEYSELTKNYDLLEKKYKQCMLGNENATQQLLIQLEKTRSQLLLKEDSLKILESKLNTRQEGLDELNKLLLSTQSKLDEKQRKIDELEALLNKRKDDIQKLKDDIANALFAYEKNGLSVTRRGGKIYVTLEENLLFESGSAEIDERGRQALAELSKILASNKDIDITIEGHTDSDPYIGSNVIKDNWDLSVLRATAVVRVLLNHSDIDPKRLVPCGRSKYIPVDQAKTAQAKQKNRRTEIILTPRLDKILDIINSDL